MVEDSEVWLRDISFQRGERYLIEAASGMGKTSLCSFIMGARNDYKGNILFDKSNIRTLGSKKWSDIRRESLAWMPQELGLFPSLTLYENLLIKNCLTSHLDARDLDELIERLELSDKKDTPVNLLSIGQQQRVAFIKMICQRADFYILDEPVSHLDDSNKQILKDLLESNLRSSGAGLIMTSVGNRMDMNGLTILKL